jgi:hypothetical protein
MARNPRPSIADQLAQISASAAPEHVETRPREHVETENAKTDASARDHVAPDEIAPRMVERGPVVRGKVQRGQVTAEGFRVRQRIEKPHVSLYAHPRVLKKVREIAAAEGCKAHDIYIEGLRLVLAKYGLDYDKLDSGEV